MEGLTCEGLPSAKLGLTNLVYVSNADFRTMQVEHPTQGTEAVSDVTGIICTVNEAAVYTVVPHGDVAEGTVAMGMLQRMSCNIAMKDRVNLRVLAVPKPHNFVLGSATVELSPLSAAVSSKVVTMDADDIQQKIKANFNRQVLKVGQEFAIIHERMQLRVTVTEVALLEQGETGGSGSDSDTEGKGGAAGAGAGSGGRRASVSFGQLTKGTMVSITKNKEAKSIKLTGASAGGGKTLFSGGFNFESLGIGGLDEEFQTIFRRAFSARVFPPDVVKHMGYKHVRGMMLYGPPGCGKTLIARQIGRALNAHDPKVVNGPEILNKFVGASEENIRNLFKEAEEEQEASGDDSDLHIIIFDEIDAICKSRGSSRDGTGVHDSIVNQLLSKIDGVDALNNILIIGMTNRMDMIDEALLRPGRLEVHVEIGLPNEAGRVQIFNIHTTEMRTHGHLEDSVNIKTLAKKTKNFTGAEIEGLIRAAGSFAFRRCVDPVTMRPRKDVPMVVTMADFDLALADCKPQFGVTEDDLKSYFRNGIVPYGEPFSTLQRSLSRTIAQVKTSERTSMLSTCVYGKTGAGKSAVTAMIAAQSGFPFVKRIGADTMIGYSESGKAAAIVKVFEDSYRSPLSLIILDDLERLVDYVGIGPRFSNTVLQTLMVLLKKPPPTEGRKLMVLATTSEPDVMSALGLMSAFHLLVEVPLLEDPEHIKRVLMDTGGVIPPEHLTRIADNFAEPVPIDRLLMTLEMARQGVDEVTFENFYACATETGLWK